MGRKSSGENWKCLLSGKKDYKLWEEKEMRRVFVICRSAFPRGGAIANYLQYLMLALRDAGYKSYLLTGLNREIIKDTKTVVEWKKIKICPVLESSNRIVKHFQYKVGFSNEHLTILKKMNVGKSDLVIVFGSNQFFLRRLLKLQEKRKFKIIGSLLEMFEEKDMSGRNPKKEYKNYHSALENIYPQFDAMMPISTYICDYYNKKGVKTYCIPIMADSLEYKVKKKKKDKIRFIIPASGKMKDDFSGMIRAFLFFSQTQLEKMEIHICGVKEAIVNEILSEKEREKLKSSLMIHKWMEYEELIALYQQMHFLVLARRVSQMTLANFPSKVPETMAFGIVPIVSDVGDYTKYYLENNKNSYFIKEAGERACYQAIKTAMEEFNADFDKMSQNARLCVETKFDYRVWIPAIKNMIEEVMEGKKK